MDGKKLGNFVVPMVMMTVAVVAGLTIKNMIDKKMMKKTAPQADAAKK